MRVSRVVFLLLSIFAVGCSSSSTRQIGDGSDNIPVAGAGNELKDINFGYDSYSVDELAKSTLKDHAKWLQTNSDRKVQIEGHCDERGTSEYNMVLGANRANAASDYLKTLGVDASRMSTVSYGEELPLDPRSTDDAWAKNRRAHFNVN